MEAPGASTSTTERPRSEEGRRCTGAELQRIFSAATRWLEAHADRINALNVFPVPDGDTGTNMAMTLRAAAEAAAALSGAGVGAVAQAAARGALMGARGNSGVILSQILRGWSQALEGKEEMDGADLAEALQRGAEVAYASVGNPVEGTILTVARATAEAALAAARGQADLLGVLVEAERAAAAAVAETPSQLPILKQAGVVDAGGEGYHVILEGALMFVRGVEPESIPVKAPSGPSMAVAHALGERAFGYCTEFVIIGQGLDVDAIRARVERMGESVLTVGDSELVRVHVHTPRPGQILDYAGTLGQLDRIKIENMELQNEQVKAAAARAAAAALEGVSVVAVVPGTGLQAIFRELGADVVPGGQTMNPSTSEILAAIEAAPHPCVIVLPNNKNVIRTALQAQSLTGRDVKVVSTVNVAQGVAALVAVNYEAGLEENARRMAEAATRTRCIEITRAIRDARIDDLEVRQGEYMAFLDGRLVAAGSDLVEALLAALRQGGAAEREVITLYYGSDATDEEAERIAATVRAAFPNAEVQAVAGGQPHYPYIVAVE